LHKGRAIEIEANANGGIALRTFARNNSELKSMTQLVAIGSQQFVEIRFELNTKMVEPALAILRN
jgi:hypothetical protein